MTWSEYLRRARGYHREQENHWRRTRWQTNWLLNIQVKQSDRLSVEELLPLPSDPPPPPPPTAEEQADLIASILRRDAAL